VLIDILNNLPEEIVERISPASLKTKKLLKLSMVLYITSSAMMSALMAMLFKLVMNILYNYPIYNSLFELSMLLILCSIFTLLQVYTINVAMKNYDQMEVIPIFQTVLMIFWILTGMLLLDEIQFYTTSQIWRIVLAVLICALGVYFLVKKKTFLKREVIYEEGGGYQRDSINDDMFLSTH